MVRQSFQTKPQKPTIRAIGPISEGEDAIKELVAIGV